jgi:hypothetical protein
MVRTLFAVSRPRIAPPCRRPGTMPCLSNRCTCCPPPTLNFSLTSHASRVCDEPMCSKMSANLSMHLTPFSSPCFQLNSNRPHFVVGKWTRKRQCSASHSMLFRLFESKNVENLCFEKCLRGSRWHHDRLFFLFCVCVCVVVVGFVCHVVLFRFDHLFPLSQQDSLFEICVLLLKIHMS